MPFVSVTVATTALVPAALGVPATVTVAEVVFDAVTLAGKPVIVQLYEPEPPVAVNDPLYAVPTVPVAGNVPVIASAVDALEITTGYVAELECE